MQGIIVENKSNIYHVRVDGENTIYSCYARGKFKKDEINPVVGDKVQFTVTDETKKEAVIDKIEERKVYIKRPKLSNLTTLIFVVSSKDPEPDLLMLDKQLAFAEFLNINAVIVLNKTDLDTTKKFKKIKEIYSKIGYTIVETEAKNGIGIEELKKAISNNISAFAGNSGVGKSTLINAIFNNNVTIEGEISQKNKRGKNTTTSIKLYEIDKNTYIADTPGFSTFSIEEIKSKDLDKYFIEFKNEIPNCEFIGCTHIKEENCGIKRAVEEGKIDKSRYERFCKIKEELSKREEKKKW